MDNNNFNNFNNNGLTNNNANNAVNPNAQPASEASGKTVDDVLAQMRRTAEAQNNQSQNNTHFAQNNGQTTQSGNEPPRFNETSRVESPYANNYGADQYSQNRQYTDTNASQSNEPQGFARYRNTSSNFASTPRETVYIDNSKKPKTPKARLGAGAVAALVLVCMLFSGGAAFTGTFIANKMSANESAGGAGFSGNATAPSVIFQSYDNKNKTAGTYEQVAEAVAPTVVEITTESVATGSYMWGNNYVISGAGSGVIISSDGLIITNNHVVSGATAINVRMNDGKEFPATLIGADSDSDIAVIKVEATGLPCALIGNSDSLKVGEEVVAVGNPLGEFGGSVTNGIISGLSRSVTIDGTEMSLLQTNAAVNPGNSGGGLFNLYGELIGVVNAKSSASGSGTSVEGIGFAIPVNKASEVATELVNYGYVRGKVYIGITFVDVANQWDAMNYRVNALGVYVVSSEFEENKFQSGDRIVAINDEVVEFSDDIKSALKNYKVGDVVTVKVVRNGQYVDVAVTLHEYVPTETKTETADNGSTFNRKPTGEATAN